MDISILFVTPRSRIPQWRPYGFYELITHISRAVTNVGLVEPPPLTNRPLPPSITSFEIPVLNLLKHVDWPLPHMVKLAKVVKHLEHDYDIIHFFSQNYPFSLCSMILKKPKIITIESFPGIDYDHGDLIINLFSGLYSRTFARIALKHMDGIISIYRSATNALRALGIRPKHLAYIPLGIDTRKIRPDEDVRREVREEMGLRDVVAIFLGRLSTVKGIAFLVKAISKLEAMALDIDFLVVGEGPEKKLFKQVLRNEHVRVHLLGFRPDPIRFLCAADFLVLPSLGEGCSNVILEAFACGKPVIATSVGAIPDIVEHGVTGFIVEPKNVEELVNAMRIMSSDVDLARTMGERARKYAERELDWRVIVRRVLQFYEEVLKLGRAS